MKYKRRKNNKSATDGIRTHHSCVALRPLGYADNCYKYDLIPKKPDTALAPRGFPIKAQNALPIAHFLYKMKNTKVRNPRRSTRIYIHTSGKTHPVEAHVTHC